MAELAALGVAASIIQVIDVGIRVLKRLEEYRAQVKAFPKALQPICVRLPTLTDALRSTERALDSMTDDVRNALKPCVDGCLEEMRALEDLLKKIAPEKSDSASVRAWKAIISVKHEGEIKGMDNNIERYIQALSNHATLTSSNRTLANQRPPPKPESTCPFSQDPDFVDRDVMNQVMTRCKPGRKLALMGIGGVGKSHIAIEYAHRVRTDAPQTWVFWVSMEKAATAATGFRNIAKALHIPGCNEKEADIFGPVRDWLKDDTHGPWTMILDNVDDVNVLTAPAPHVRSTNTDSDAAPPPQIREFITSSQNGSILVTSRNTEAAQMITGNCAYHIDVEEMNEAEAVALLKSKLSSKVLYKEEEATDLVKAVDYMPLAISQIATNISLNYPRLTIPKAIQKLQNPSPETTQLLEASIHESSRDVHRSNSIIKTWHLSFQYVQESSPSAARLLSLMCLFHRQDIPEALLKGKYKEEAVSLATRRQQPRFMWWKRIRRHHRLRMRRPQPYTQRKTEAKDRLSDFDDDWRVLTNFALIKTSLDGQHFNMHRLVQIATRRWLELKQSFNHWTRRYIHILRVVFPQTSTFDNWALRQYLFSHAQEAVAYRPNQEEALEFWAPLIFSVADHEHYMDDYTAAARSSRVVCELYKESYGPEDVRTLESAHFLADCLRRLKQYPEAEAMFKWVLSRRLKVLGLYHHDTLDTLYRLAQVLQAQGKTEEADRLFEKRREARAKSLGANHPDVQLDVHGTAFHMMHCGLYHDAEALYRQTTKDAIASFGQNSEQALVQTEFLVSALTKQGKYDEAIQHSHDIIKARQEEFGAKSGMSFKAMIKLAEVLEQQGNYAEAETQLRTAISGFEEIKWHNHDDSLAAQQRLVTLLAAQKKYAEASTLARSIVATREELLGKTHCDTLDSVHSLAEMLDRCGKHDEALTMYQKAYVEMEKLCGAEHPDTIDFRDDYNQARIKELERLGPRKELVVFDLGEVRLKEASGERERERPARVAVAAV